MKTFLTIAVCAGLLASGAPAPVIAGPGVIDRACRQSNCQAATPQLCSCIQRVANNSLSRSERRKVAKFFSDPHQAQQVRQSDRHTDEALWKRYKAFGEQARSSCG